MMNAKKALALATATATKDVEPLEPVAIPHIVITPEMIDEIKKHIKEEKVNEQKKKKNDYQREYMRHYKKNIPPTEDEILKRKVKRCLGKIAPEKLKVIIAGILGETPPI